MNLASLVQPHPAGAPALYHAGAWLDWGTVRRRSSQVAAELIARGLRPDDRVALAWPTSVEFVTGYLGVLAAGGVAVPLNPNAPAPELSAELELVEPSFVLAGGPARRALERLTTPHSWVVVPETPEPSSSAGSAAEADRQAEVLPVVERRDDDVAVLLFTSGTAGAPRAAMLTHGNLVSNLRQMLAVPGEMVRADDVALAVVPLFHIFGLNVVLGLSLMTGSGLVLEERFDAVETLDRVVELGVTILFGVPTMYHAWTELPDQLSHDGELSRRVRRAISGAASLAASVAERFEARFGVTLWQGYGLTEASPAVATARSTAHHPGSVGRPLPGVDVRLVDEVGDDVLAGDPGEIWVRGPNVFAGYWRDEEASRQVLTDDGWLRTGDVGVLGEGGDLFVVERRKDLVIVSGFNVYPAEVERVVAQLPEVGEVVALGVPDAATGEAVEVVIVRRPGSELSAEQVRAHCAAQLARYKCPVSVRFLADLPRGLAGKALRRALGSPRD